MNILFIGQCEYGSTSRMRFEMIEQYFKCSIILINLTPIIQLTWKPFRSIGWRFHFGPLVESINKAILSKYVEKVKYDLVWIEKGVFIKESTLKKLKNVASKLVHFTPDPAFLYHKSSHFTKGLYYYDFCITTKCFEVEIYHNKGAKNVLYCTQGYDEQIHKPMVSFENKIYDICFIGHHENEREVILNKLLQRGYTIALAGIKWKRFVRRNRHKRNLHYFGDYVVGEKYSLLISQSILGLGLLSKWIPEKHTTRTMEIPACGTVLVTEKNEETSIFFNDEDVVFYKESNEIPKVIFIFFQNFAKAKVKSKNGYNAITNGSFSHKKIMFKILGEVFK
jgi:spore maturation protein CgeB